MYRGPPARTTIGVDVSDDPMSLEVSVHSRAGSSGSPNDDRIYRSSSDGLFAIADARGPSYGYHQPIGVEKSWESLLSVWRSRKKKPLPERIVDAMNAANEAALGPAKKLESTASSFTAFGIDGPDFVV